MVVQMLMVAGAEPTPLWLRAVGKLESRSARRVQQDDEQDHP